MSPSRRALGLGRPAQLAPGVDVPREAIRELLAASPWPPGELAERLGISTTDLVRQCGGEAPVPSTVRLRTARLLELRAESLERLATELRKGIWEAPSAGDRS